MLYRAECWSVQNLHLQKIEGNKSDDAYMNVWALLEETRLKRRYTRQGRSNPHGGKDAVSKSKMF